MLPQIEIEVENVKGHCTRGYKKGDRWRVKGFDTPDRFCGGAYTALYPIIVSFICGARFASEKDPDCKTKLACPDNGSIIFKVTNFGSKNSGKGYEK